MIERSDDLSKYEIIEGCEATTPFALFFVESSEVLEPETNRNVKRNTVSSREFTKLDCLSASLCGSGKFSAVLLFSTLNSEL